ncbi:MAG: RidA family protein [Holophaga sp.]|jgi:2-iminobutanoate/2-iminopropanoate deaminase
MARKAITTEAAVVVGPYSPGVQAGKFVFLSGQTPMDPATGILMAGDVGAQTAQCFKNLAAVLKAAGLSLDHVVKVNVFLTDMNDFETMNAVYETQFRRPFPARSTIGVAALPKGARIEIELIARVPSHGH